MSTADENKTSQALTGVMPKLVLALMQVPVFGGLKLWWPHVQEHPVAAAAIAVAYEVLLFIVAVLAKVEGKAVERTADWLWAGIINFAPGFRRRYKRQIIRDHGVFNVKGLGLLNTYTLKLEKVFVNLRIAPSSNPLGANVDLVTQREFAGNQPVWEFLRVKRRKNDDALALAIIGPPGCGKTTLLRHVALTLADNHQRHYRSRAFTPVLLFLRDHVAAITGENPPAIGTLAQEYFSKKQLYPSLKMPGRWFEKQVEKGRCIILLDGMDEIADLEKRRAVAAWVDNQIRNYPECRFIVTARPQGYLDAPLERASVLLEVQPFNAEQVSQFVSGWYLANEIKSSGNEDNREVRARAERDAQDLMRRLRGLPALSALTVNPLLLTMIAMVHRFKGSLPGKRVGLYADICEVLLGRWQETKGLPDSLSAAQKLVVLRPLADGLMTRRIRDIKTNEAAALIEPHLKRVGYVEPPDVFLKNLESGSGLFLEREPGLWSFAHLTFQEYLTAAHWLEERIMGCDWGAMADDSWWHETLRLYAAQGDATPIVQACLAKDTVAALTLAADCLEEAREMEDNIRHAAEERLIADLGSPDDARRRLAAEVKLLRRLKSLHSIDDQRAIDPTYLTCAEYQLFLDDMRPQDKHHQPDHWMDFKFNEGEASKPVAGMGADDARAFCQWLTQQYGGNAMIFRLPSLEEANQSSALDSRLASWCEKGNKDQLTKLEAATEQRVREHLATIADTAYLPLPLSFYVFPVRSVARAVDRALGYAIIRAHARAQALEAALALVTSRTHTRTQEVAKDLIHAQTQKNDQELTPDSILAQGLTLEQELTLDRDLARARTQALELDCELAHTLDYTALNRARAVAYDLTCTRARALIHSLDLAQARNLASSHYLEFRNLVFSLTDALQASQLPKAVGLSRTLEKDSNAYIARWGGLFRSLLAVAGAETLLAVRQAYRKYIIILLQYIYLEFDASEKVEGEQRRWFRRKAPDGLANSRQAILELYWWLQIVQAREEGKLPAWEGIRIIREQVQ